MRTWLNDQVNLVRTWSGKILTRFDLFSLHYWHGPAFIISQYFVHELF